MQPYRRPDSVPALRLEGLPEYVSTSEEEDDEDEEDQTNSNQKATALQGTADSIGDTNL